MARLKDRLKQFDNWTKDQGIVGQSRKLNRQIDDQITNRPEYEISDNYDTNQAIALNNAFGRDNSIMQQESNLENSASDAIGQAQQYSSSTDALLNTLSSITNNKNNALRNLAGDEAAIQQQKLGAYMGANTAMAEEQDKAWNYNTNQPYQNELQRLVQKKKNRQENLWKGIDAVTSLGMNFLAPGSGMLTKGKLSPMGQQSMEEEFAQNGWS